MNRSNHLLPATLVAAALLAACQGSAEIGSDKPAGNPATTAGDTSAQASTQAQKQAVRSGGAPGDIEMPPADAPTPAIAEGAEVIYSCDDGSELRVRYAGIVARVTAPDESYVQVSRTGADGETYADNGTTLRRLANVVEITQGGATRRCSESGGNA